MELRFRPCERKDLPALIRLCEDHARFEGAAYDQKDKQEKLEEFLFRPDPPLFCRLVEMDGTLAGYFSYTFDFSTWDAAPFLHLDCLYLEPPCRGKGIGKIVMEEVLKIAKEGDCVNVQWQTPVFNENAIRFYEKIGGVGKEKVRFSLGARG